MGHNFKKEECHGEGRASQGNLCVCGGGGISTIIAQCLLQTHNEKKVGFECNDKSDGVQHQEWRHSTANIKNL